MTDEAALMLRMCAFGLAASAAYWLVTTEPLGTAAFAALGLAPGVVGALMYVDGRRQGHKAPRGEGLARFAGFSPAPPPREEDLAADDLGIIPTPVIWPFAIGFGFTVMVTGLIFGTWLIIGGLAITFGGAVGWFRAVSREQILGQRKQ